MTDDEYRWNFFTLAVIVFCGLGLGLLMGGVVGFFVVLIVGVGLAVLGRSRK